jgi:hypothetical protein
VVPNNIIEKILDYIFFINVVFATQRVDKRLQVADAFACLYFGY